jgi:hypothetical protein
VVSFAVRRHGRAIDAADLARLEIQRPRLASLYPVARPLARRTAQAGTASCAGDGV